MILNPSYFEGELTIAQAGEHTPSGFALNSELQWYVNEYEPVFYRATIGETLYRQMIDGTEETESASEAEADMTEPEEPNKWLELVNHTAKYAAMFVWIYYMKDLNTITSGSGQTVPEYESGFRKSPQPKMVNIWNKMMDNLFPMTQWVCDRKDDYPEFAPDEDLFRKCFMNKKGELIYENLYGI
jgi:hypothetical protein